MDKETQRERRTALAKRNLVSCIILCQKFRLYYSVTTSDILHSLISLLLVLLRRITTNISKVRTTNVI
jgi:hypothetical protein